MPRSLIGHCKSGIRAAIAALLIGAAGFGGAIPSAHADYGDGIAGDPNSAAQYWSPQSLADDCSLMSVTDVVGQLTGFKPSEEEIVNLAASTPSASHEGPIFTPPSPENPGPGLGTWITDLPILLDHYGVGSVYTNDKLATEGGLPSGVLALAEDLHAGKRVIVSVNWETLRDKPGDRTMHNHAVVVTGVNTDNGTVHLNDSAYTGPNSEVSLDAFDASWQTSLRGMVVAG